MSADNLSRWYCGIAMGTSFDAKTKSIGDLLSANTREKIVVPTFQRGYEWEKKHVQAFWKDIKQHESERTNAGASGQYFLGPIVTLKKQDTIELLDGQQRLATATILLSVLRDIAKSTGIPDGTQVAQLIQSELITKEVGGFSLQLGETDENYFRETIQNDGQVTAKPKIRTHRNIKAARDILMAKVTELTSPDNPQATLTVLRSLKQILRSDLVMACIPVDSERDAFRIFETLNDRGLRLSVPDLLLNYLMREAKPEADRKQIRKFWTDMVERMGKRDINRFMRHMWVSKYGDLKATDLFTALKDHIEKNNIGSLDFAKVCADECESYVQLITFDENHLQKDAAKYVRRVLQGLNAQPALPLLMAAFRNLQNADFVKVCQWLLVFVTRHSAIAKLDPAGMETVLYALAREIRKQTEDKAKPTTITKYVKDTLVANAPSDSQVKSADLILSPDDAGYVMSRLAVSMQTATKEVTVDEANLEHVFPKNPEENEWGGKANQELLEPYLWHIGNMTILGERLNRESGNKEFSVKKPYYAKNSELEITKQIARDYNDWNVQTIEARGNKLIEQAVKVWDFDNPSLV